MTILHTSPARSLRFTMSPALHRPHVTSRRETSDDTTAPTHDRRSATQWHERTHPTLFCPRGAPAGAVLTTHGPRASGQERQGPLRPPPSTTAPHTRKFGGGASLA